MSDQLPTDRQFLYTYVYTCPHHTRDGRRCSYTTYNWGTARAHFRRAHGVYPGTYTQGSSRLAFVYKLARCMRLDSNRQPVGPCATSNEDFPEQVSISERVCLKDCSARCAGKPFTVVGTAICQTSSQTNSCRKQRRINWYRAGEHPHYI